MSTLDQPSPPVDGRVNVLFVLPSLKGGGAERVAVTLLCHLDRARIKPALAVLNCEEPAYAADLPTDVEIIDLKSPRVRLGLFALLRLIWRTRPNVVFSMIGHLNLGLALLRPFLPRGVRLCARETNVISEMLGDHPQGLLWRAAYTFLYRRFDAVICQSDHMRSELVEVFGVTANRTVVIRNPIDVERIRGLASAPMDGQSWQTGSIRLIAVGRLTYEKGVDLLLEAVALVDHPAVEVLVLGAGPLRGALEHMARTLGLTDRVRFLGFVRNPYRYMARADALVLSSRFEAFPNVVLESLACGVPVIATPAHGGMREMALGQLGVTLAEEISAASLAHAIERYSLRDHGGRLQADLSSYRASTIAAQYEALFVEKSH